MDLVLLARSPGYLIQHMVKGDQNVQGATRGGTFTLNEVQSWWSSAAGITVTGALC